MPTHYAATREEIHERIQRGYLERLDSRVRKMRQCLAERDWNLLRVECLHLHNTAPGFGQAEIARLAAETAAAIPAQDASRALALPEAREACERLFAAIQSAVTRGVPIPSA